jgi:hypothetical protein
MLDYGEHGACRCDECVEYDAERNSCYASFASADEFHDCGFSAISGQFVKRENVESMR